MPLLALCSDQSIVRPPLPIDLILSCLENVVTEQRFWRYDEGAKTFTLERSLKGQMGISPSVSAVDAEGSDAIWVTSDGYTQPTTLAIADAATPDDTTTLKSLPSFFDADGVHTEQHYATSADGTKVISALARAIENPHTPPAEGPQ